MKKIIFSTALVASLLGLTACGESAEEKPEEASAPATENVTTDTSTEEPKAKEEVPEKKDDVPREHSSALKKGESYANMMHMSKAGVYDQLTSEYGDAFPAEAAQYAIDNLEIDWKENARKKAEDYAKTMNMSDSGIYDQLVSEHGEKFTAEEAQYAIDNLQ